MANPVLVDSSAWIELLGKAPLWLTVREHLPSSEDWIVPTMVQLEVSKWLQRERSSDDIRDFVSFTTTLQVVPLDTDIAVAAAAVCVEHKLATADAIIFATAQAYNATLLTCDSHFAGLPNTIVVPNKR